MKVIDLLNKIANGEEVPEKIKWEDIIYAYSEYDKDYLEYPFSEDEYRGLFNMKDSILTQYLNEEVEIIEDTPKVQVEITEEEYLQWLDEKNKYMEEVRNYKPNPSYLTPKEDKKIEKLDYLNSDYYYKNNTYGAISNEEIVLDIKAIENYINKLVDKINGDTNE